MLQVDELDLARRLTVSMRESVTSTNVFVHVEATRAAAGIGLLPCFMADRHDDLVRVLPGQVEADAGVLARRAPRVAAPAGGRGGGGCHPGDGGVAAGRVGGGVSASR